MLRRCHIASVCLACCLVAAQVAGPIAADRDARAITPSGSPVWLDPWRALLFDNPAVVVMLENRHTAPITATLRIWLFDSGLRLRGSVDYCTQQVLDRHTRGTVFVPLDIPGVTLQDRAVVTVAAVGSGRTVWRLRQSEAGQLAAARAAAEGSTPHLDVTREEDGPGTWECPCDPSGGGGGLFHALWERRPGVERSHAPARFGLLGVVHVPLMPART